MISKLLLTITLLYYFSITFIDFYDGFFLIVNLITIALLIALALSHYLTIKTRHTSIGVIAVVMLSIVVYYMLFWYMIIPVLLITWIILDSILNKKRLMTNHRYFSPQTNKRVFLYIGMLNEQEYSRRRNPLAPQIGNNLDNFDTKISMKNGNMTEKS